MSRSLKSVILLVSLLASTQVHAEQAKRPTRADRIAADAALAERLISERRMTCVYGKTRFEADSQGRLVITTSRVCTEVSR